MSSAPKRRIEHVLRDDNPGVARSRFFVRTVILLRESMRAEVEQIHGDVTDDYRWELAIQRAFMQAECPDCMYSPITGHRC